MPEAAPDAARPASGAPAGILRKMRVHPGTPVSYELVVGEHRVPLNAHLGRRAALRLTGVARCLACGRETRRSYSQGYCYPCSQRLARCDLCVLRPEQCHYQAGTCREPDWGRAHCMREHVVYLANSSGVKVGITSAGNAPTRWIDQGAVAAVAVLAVSTRRDAGLVEAALREQVADRTDWRRMLRGDPEPVDLGARARALLASPTGAAALAGIAGSRRLPLAEVAHFRYPVLRYPQKVRSIDPLRLGRVEGTLLGMKGQYLILDTGVVNVRRLTGYEAAVELGVPGRD